MVETSQFVNSVQSKTLGGDPSITDVENSTGSLQAVKSSPFDFEGFNAQKNVDQNEGSPLTAPPVRRRSFANRPGFERRASLPPSLVTPNTFGRDAWPPTPFPGTEEAKESTIPTTH